MVYWLIIDLHERWEGLNSIRLEIKRVWTCYSVFCCDIGSEQHDWEECEGEGAK